MHSRPEVRGKPYLAEAWEDMPGYFMEVGGNSWYLPNASCPPLGDFVYVLNTFASTEAERERI